MAVSKENSTFAYAQLALPEDTERVKSTCLQGKAPLPRGQEDTGSFLYQTSAPFGTASQSLDSLLLPGHPASLLDGIWGLCLAEDGKQRKSTPKPEGTPNPPQKQEGSKPTPKPERSEVRGNADGKKQEQIKVGLWHRGLPINSATAPDLRSRGRSRPPLGIQVRRLRACFPTGQCSFF